MMNANPDIHRKILQVVAERKERDAKRKAEEAAKKAEEEARKKEEENSAKASASNSVAQSANASLRNTLLPTRLRPISEMRFARE